MLCDPAGQTASSLGKQEESTLDVNVPSRYRLEVVLKVCSPARVYYYHLFGFFFPQTPRFDTFCVRALATFSCFGRDVQLQRRRKGIAERVRTQTHHALTG